MSSEEIYEWDEAKRASNLTKHKVDFADVVAFDWNLNITREDDDVNGEDVLYRLQQFMACCMC